MIRLPKYVHGFNDRHGKPRFYLRRPGRKRVALPGLPWSTEFMDLYQAALNDAAPIVVGINRSKQGSVAEAVARYLGSIVFAELAPSTERGEPFTAPGGRDAGRAGNRCRVAQTCFLARFDLTPAPGLLPARRRHVVCALGGRVSPACRWGRNGDNESTTKGTVRTGSGLSRKPESAMPCL